MKDRIYLVGFMGSGKTTVGRRVAAALGWAFVDLDEEIVRREGHSVAEMFDSRGEDYFRRIEAECLRAVSSEGRRVVALGGGTYVDQDNREFVDTNGISVFLDAPIHMILERVDDDGERPLLRDKDSLGDLYRRRRPSYKMAAVTLDTEGLGPEEVASQILKLIRDP